MTRPSHSASARPIARPGKTRDKCRWARASSPARATMPTSGNSPILVSGIAHLKFSPAMRCVLKAVKPRARTHAQPIDEGHGRLGEAFEKPVQRILVAEIGLGGLDIVLGGSRERPNIAARTEGPRIVGQKRDDVNVGIAGNAREGGCQRAAHFVIKSVEDVRPVERERLQRLRTGRNDLQWLLGLSPF